MLAKPPVPARPTGSKISALQAGFMNDLNKKLGLGPVAPKKEESREEPKAEEEKAPLADARKGRAKGPQRRKPGVSTSGAAEEEKKVSKPAAVRFAISRPMTIWEVDESGELSMGGKSAEAPAAEEPAEEPAREPAEGASDENTAPSSSKETTTTGTDMAVQTGELDISMMTDTATGEHEAKTVYLGGRAPEPGSVVVDADGTQHVGSPDSLGSIEKTGLGM
jgi:Altered inheritance of mitochondria protein 21